MSRGRRIAAALLVPPLALALAGCGDQTTHLRNICSDVTRGTAELPRYDPDHPVTALQTALGRFALVDKAVGAARHTALPGAAAPVLRSDWLEPAVRSMAGWDAALAALRTAVADGGREQVSPALGTALALGTGGVDTAALRGAGFGSCADAFTPPSAGSLTSG